MFAYSFCAMAGWNVVKPATRSQFINSLGADNLPYVQLVAGLIMGFVIQGYTSAMKLLPRRWVFAATQVVMIGLLLGFWVLFQTGQGWVSVAFYLWGVLAGSLLISQFWTLANDVYDPRQAKRVFGFIGGGSSLGGMVGAGFAGQYAKAIGTTNLILVAAVILAVCFGVIWMITVREKPAETGKVGGEEDSISLREAVQLLMQSKHFQVIALVISFAAIGAGIVEQQMNMAVEDQIADKDARTAFIGNVIFYSSLAGFFIQMTLTSRLHRLLGIGFALLLLPITLGGTGVLMLMVPDALDVGHRPRRGHGAPLQRGQDHARNPVHAAPDEHEVPGQALRGRGGRSVRQGSRRAPAHHRDQGVRFHLVAAQLHQPGRRRTLGPAGAARPAGVPAKLPEGPGDPGDRHGGPAGHGGGPGDDRDARRRTGPSGRGARRSTRSTCSNRWTSAIWSRRCCSTTPRPPCGRAR